MPKTTKPLTDKEVKLAKPKEKEYTLTDGYGLFLLVLPSGVKTWRFNYTRPYSKKRTKISLGVYPTVTLAQARATPIKRVCFVSGIFPNSGHSSAFRTHYANCCNAA